MKKGELTKERLIEELKDDPLFDKIEIMGLVDVLLDDRTVGFLKEDIPYSSADFEKMFCNINDEETFLAKQGIMRQFMKEMAVYLDTSSISRLVVLDYKGFIKLKMALMLRKNGMRPAMIFELSRVTKYSSHVLHSDQDSVANHIVDDSEMAKVKLRNDFIDALMYKMVETKLVKYDDDNVVFDSSLFKLAAGLIENKSLLDGGQASTQEKIDDLIEDKALEEELLTELQELFFKINDANPIEDNNRYIVEMENLKDIYKGKTHLINDYIIKAQHILNNQKKEIDDVSQTEEVLAKLQDLYYKIEDKSTIEEMKVVIEEMKSFREVYTNDIPLINDYVIRTEQYMKNKEIQIVNDGIKNVENQILMLIENIKDRTTNRNQKREYMNEIDELIKSNPRISTSIKLQVNDIRRDVNKKFLGLF